MFEEVDDEMIAIMNEEESLLKTEISDLQTRIGTLKQELEGVWKDEQKVAYELTSVFIHRGSTPTFGHYFFYSRNLPGAPDEWFKYNDSEVSTIPKEEVLADTTGSTANPYLVSLCFIARQYMGTDTFSSWCLREKRATWWIRLSGLIHYQSLCW